MNIEQAVKDRYSQGAKEVQPALCCPASTYDEAYLKVIPEEIIQRDYGCGDPTQWCTPGQTVVDLGSGGGKACYIMSQRVGPEGRVIGIDMNDDMLALARKHRRRIARDIGYDNVEFRKARIQDLRLDIEQLDAWLQKNPIRSSADLERLESFTEELSKDAPVIPDNSVDLIVSNCVLNLVRPSDKARLFKEMFRVLREGGRAVISDITSDEDVPEAMMNDEELWSGCISGAYREDLFLQAFLDADFQAVSALKYDIEPWRTVNGIEFRSTTVSAYKVAEGPCLEQNQAVIYRGPYSEVRDDDAHRFPRGVRVAVCGKTFERLKMSAYRDSFVFISPREPVEPEHAAPFDCARNSRRQPSETKGAAYDTTTEPDGNCCDPSDRCC